MTTKAKTPKPVRSGFCGLGNPPESHRRCPGWVHGDHTCPCVCHTPPSATITPELGSEYGPSKSKPADRHTAAWRIQVRCPHYCLAADLQPPFADMDAAVGWLDQHMVSAHSRPLFVAVLDEGEAR